MQSDHFVQVFIIFNIKIIMSRLKSRVVRNPPFSALDCYEPQDHFAGWEASETPKQEDIFKQLRINLSKYEKKYNDSKRAENEQRLSSGIVHKKTIEDKENDVKLPVIVHSTPLKRIQTNKELFAVRNRNILQDAINYSDEHQEKFFKISRLFKIRRNLIYQENQEHKKERKADQAQIKKVTHKVLADYDFSDSRLHPRSNKAHLRRIENENEEFE